MENNFSGYFRKGMDYVKSGYSYIKNAKSQLCMEINDLFEYTASSVDHLAFQSAGLTGVIDDFIIRERVFTGKFDNVKSKFRKIKSDISDVFKNKNIRKEKTSRGEVHYSKYDRSKASDEMQKEMISMYCSSGKKLGDVANYLSNKYNMNISSSTISRLSRKRLYKDGNYFRNRMSAQRYYSKKM